MQQKQLHSNDYESDIKISEILDIIFRSKKIITLISLAFSIIAFSIAVSIKPIYISTANLKIGEYTLIENSEIPIGNSKELSTQLFDKFLKKTALNGEVILSDAIDGDTIISLGQEGDYSINITAESHFTENNLKSINEILNYILNYYQIKFNEISFNARNKLAMELKTSKAIINEKNKEFTKRISFFDRKIATLQSFISTYESFLFKFKNNPSNDYSKAMTHLINLEILDSRLKIIDIESQKENISSEFKYTNGPTISEINQLETEIDLWANVNYYDPKLIEDINIRQKKSLTSLITVLAFLIGLITSITLVLLKELIKVYKRAKKA
jgi:LPS O-antigen subunit length determinant protein (WzzB/FepE family)